MPCFVTLLQLGNGDDDVDAGCNQGASAHAQENHLISHEKVV
jgi:hypothetical protein